MYFVNSVDHLFRVAIRWESKYGSSLGGNPSREVIWNPVIQKVKDILALWKRGFMSKGGRLILIKAVLSSLSTFFMSVFGIPLGWQRESKSSKKIFFWNNDLVKRKVHAVDWDS